MANSYIRTNGDVYQVTGNTASRNQKDIQDLTDTRISV